MVIITVIIMKCPRVTNYRKKNKKTAICESKLYELKIEKEEQETLKGKHKCILKFEFVNLHFYIIETVNS